MNMKAICPVPESWLDLLEDRVDSSRRSALEGHLEGCESCLEAMARLAGGWSFADRVIAENSPVAGMGTMAMLAKMAALLPEIPDYQRESAERFVPPNVPGLVEWEPIGRGGMGVVFRAREVELDRPVAVKVLSTVGRLEPSARVRAMREALLMASLRHPNVVPVHRFGEFDGMPLLIMEWSEEGTLQDRVGSGPLSAREAAETVRDLAGAVAEAHALGIVHRDLKPSNVLLFPAAGPVSKFVPKLTDFGLARRGDAVNVTEAGVVLGTPEYMAPEQTGIDRNFAEVGPATDIHGLGAILYACLTGRAPYAGRNTWESLVRSSRGARTSLREFRSDVQRDLATIVDKCLHPSPAKRYRSAGELADDLGRFLEGRPISARSTSAPERWLKWARRHPASAAFALLLTASSIVGIAGTAYHIASISATNQELAKEQNRTRTALASALVEQGKTHDALESATSARDRAREALTSLSNDVLRRIVERGSVLNESDRLFLANIRNLYLEWPLEPDPEASFRLRCEGMGRLADIFEQIDQYRDAQICREAAIASYDEAIRRGLGGPTFVDARLKALVLLHQLLGRAKQPAAGEAVARRLIELREPLSRKSFDSRHKFALDHIRLGDDLAMQGRHPEAEASFREGIDRLESLSVEKPDDQAILEAEIRALYFYATRTESTATSQARLQQMLRLADSATIRFPNNVKLFRYQTLGLYQVVKALQADRPEEALKVHRRRMEQARKLIKLTPGDPNSLEDIIFGAAQAYGLCVRLGRPLEAEPELREAVKEGRRLVEAEPAVYERTRALTEAVEAYAELCDATGRPRDSLEHFESLAATLTPWAGLQNRSAEVVPIILKARSRAAVFLAKQDDWKGVDRQVDLALALCSGETRTQFLAQLAEMHRAAGDLPGAKAALERAAAKSLATPNGENK